MENSSLKECLDASENLLKVLDNADHGSWCWKDLGKLLNKAEKINNNQK